MRQFVAAVIPLMLTVGARAADEFEREPILYSESAPDNRISRLQQRLDAGDLTLTYAGDKSYLPALLKAAGSTRGVTDAGLLQNKPADAPHFASNAASHLFQ